MIKLDNKMVEVKKFPNGEVNIKTKDLNICWKERHTIKLFYENDSDLIHMMMLKKHIDEVGAFADIVITYMPYSRMDRTEGLNVFTLKFVAEFINNLKFEHVTVLEPHSEVTPALLNKCEIKNMSAILCNSVMREIEFDNEKDYIFFPDAGAEKRYSKQIKVPNTLTGLKKRDFATGYINELNVVGDVKHDNFRVIIVDDLCSRGGTFMMSANKLKELGAKEIILVVTHCENTIHDGDILKTDIIDKVYTTDSILNKNHKKINILGI